MLEKDIVVDQKNNPGKEEAVDEQAAFHANSDAARSGQGHNAQFLPIIIPWRHARSVLLLNKACPGASAKRLLVELAGDAGKCATSHKNLSSRPGLPGHSLGTSDTKAGQTKSYKNNKIVVVEEGPFVINSESWRTIPSSALIQEIVRRMGLHAQLLKRAIDNRPERRAEHSFVK